MKNEMPELKSGMVVSGKFKNDNGGREKYTGILLECDNSLFVVYANIDGKLKYISDIKNDEIDKISKIKRPSIFTVILSNDNLELIWERKPEVDWSKVAVDTKVLVRNSEDEEWKRRYFAKFEGGLVFAWNSGKTSFSVGYTEDIVSWRCAVLYEENESLVGE